MGSLKNEAPGANLPENTEEYPNVETAGEEAVNEAAVNAEGAGEAASSEEAAGEIAVKEETADGEAANGETSNAEAEQEAPNYSRLSMSAVIRALAGAYVAYLGYNAIKESISGGDAKWYIYLISGLLVAAGVFFVVTSIIQLLKINKTQNEERKKMEEDPEYKKKLEELRNRPLPTRAGSENVSRTGADIRARLQAINEEDGVEMEDGDEAEDDVEGKEPEETE